MGIGLNISGVAGQSSNNNNLIINDLQNLLSQTKQSVRGYLSTILVDAIIANVDAIFASANLNLTSLVNKSYSCSILLTTTIENFIKVANYNNTLFIFLFQPNV